MRLTDKLETLVASAQFDVCSYANVNPAGGSPLRFIHRATFHGGGYE
jgi:hypothetical protein